MVIFGAGVIGEATLYACRSLNIPVEAFVDHRIQGPLLGVSVLKLEDLRSVVPSARFFYLTSPNIKDMIDPLYQKGYTGWRSCGEVLRGFDISGIDFKSINGSNQSSKYSTEHVKYLIRTCLHHHDNYMHPERLTVQSVDLIVTEACSMRCRDCSNLAQYYEKPENSDINEMFETIDSICEKMDEVYEFRVIGGEPLVNKEVHLVVEKLTSKANIQKVSIFTNATILPREHQWNAFGHSKVRFFITEYVQSRKHKELIAELKKRNIPFATETANGWTDCAALDVHNRTDEANAAIFTACCAKNLTTLHDGALFRCPFSAHATKLQAVPDYPDDSLSVATATREQIRAFLRDKPFIKACDHCNGRSYSAPVIEAAVQTKVPLRYTKYVRAQ